MWLAQIASDSYPGALGLIAGEPLLAETQAMQSRPRPNARRAAPRHARHLDANACCANKRWSGNWQSQRSINRTSAGTDHGGESVFFVHRYVTGLIILIFLQWRLVLSYLLMLPNIDEHSYGIFQHL